MTDLFDVALSQTQEPVEFTNGDTVLWRRVDLSDYADGLFTLSYVFRPEAGGANVSPTITRVLTEFHATLTSVITAGMDPGVHFWQAYITRISDSRRVQLGSGRVTVKADLTVFTQDTREHARVVLSKIEGLIAGRADADVESYTIGGRQINKMSADELMKWRNHYRNEVAQLNDKERIKAGKPSRNTIRVRFI